MNSNNRWLALKGRYVGIDLFRITAVIVTCAYHTAIILWASYGPLQSFVIMGPVFMTAFFMISGYTLFLNYSHTNIIDGSNVKSFYIKRYIGILPMYYVAIIFYFIFSYFECRLSGTTYPIENDLLLAPIDILGLQSNFHTLFFSHNSGTWFISCILMCYLVYPLIQEVVKQCSNKTRALLIIISVFVLLYAPIIQIKFNTTTIYANPFFRILEFSIGVFLASLKLEFDLNLFVNKYLYNWITIIATNILMIVAVTVAVHLGIARDNYMLYSWICLPCFIVIIIGLSGVKFNKLENSRLIKYLTEISFVFYLTQLFSNIICKYVILKFSITNNTIILILGWGVCIIFSIIMHEIFEKPIKNYLNTKLLGDSRI